MDSPTQWDFSIVAASGLTQKEFAALARVSRISAIHWIQGRRLPSRHVAPRLAEVMKRLAAAVEAGTLPPQTPKPGREVSPELRAKRMQEIVAALKR